MFSLDLETKDLAEWLLMLAGGKDAPQQPVTAVIVYDKPRGDGIGIKTFKGPMIDVGIAQAEFSMQLYLDGGRIIVNEWRATVDERGELRQGMLGEDWELHTNVWREVKALVEAKRATNN